ncbi:MAG: leucine-rich repeat domain-containing protein [Paludibacter sp.]|nr:leucine-rich repeat domain-containing protein [Paludibacter sp.]
MKKNTLLLLFFLFTSLIYAQISKSVKITSPGTLANQLSITEQETLINLSVSGNIDARDIAFIRDKVKNVASLNLSESSIKAYSGIDGTNSGIQTDYSANVLPAYAFFNPQLLTYKPSLKSITLPSNLSSIGELAFYYSWNLGTINIPASVVSIAEYTFYGCYAMTSISVDPLNTRYSSLSGVLFNKLQDTLFVCPNGKSDTYTIPGTVKHVANSAFENCYNLSSLILPASLQSVGNNAFAYCSGIFGNLTLPSTLHKLGNGAFYGCYRLTGTVTIPAGLTNIGYYCFLESNNIKSFDVNSSNAAYSSWNDALYSKKMDTLFICPGGKTGTFNIPSSVKLIGSYAFYNCSNLKGTITIPGSTDYIGYYAFFGCSQISNYVVDASNEYFSSVEGILYSKQKDRLLICPANKTGNLLLPEGLRSIDPGALNNCTLLSGPITIPSTLAWIGDYAFYNCTGISGFVVENDNNYYSASEDVLFNKLQDSLYICPLSKSGTYNVPSTVKYIGVSAFDGCSDITGINLPSSLQVIGNYAFEYCTGLNSLLIPQNVNTIGIGAFYACKNLQQFAIANTTPPIVDYFALDSINKTSCVLTVPTGTSAIYKKAPYWGEFSQINETNFNTEVPAHDIQKYKCFRTSEGIMIEGLHSNDQIQIYSLQGLLFINTKAEEYKKYLNFPARGIFIVKINDFTEKIIL